MAKSCKERVNSLDAGNTYIPISILTNYWYPLEWGGGGGGGRGSVMENILALKVKGETQISKMKIKTFHSILRLFLLKSVIIHYFYSYCRACIIWNSFPKKN